MIVRDVKVVYGNKRVPDVPNPGAVSHAGQVVAMLRAWGIDDSPQERFAVVHLDARHRVIGIQEVGRGTLVSVEVHPREIFRGAVLQGSQAIILAHNHPSGDPTPSVDDKTVTHRLQRAGAVLGIPVVDHVIIADEEFTAAAEDEWLQEVS